MTPFLRAQFHRGVSSVLFFWLFGLLAFSGIANANVTVSVATGGGAIASNTAPGCSAAGTWTALTRPRIAEGNAGDIGVGNIVLSAPAGFEFNTAAAVTILFAGSTTNTRNINDIVNGTSVAVTSITATAITFTVVHVSASRNTLTWQGIQVRPTASAPLASGNITETGASAIAGMNVSTNLGTLTEVASAPACSPTAPAVTTNAATGLSATGATLNGTVSSNGASTAVTFDYGLTTAYGSSATATASPLVAGASGTAVSAAVTGLSCGTSYHFRAKGVNSFGTTYGNDLSFSTSACPPTIIEFNSSGGTSATNGLHFYIEDSTKLQVKRLDNTGQVYNPNAVPTDASLDNGVFLRANGLLYGPSHNVSGFTPSGGNFDSVSLSAASPANPSSAGVQQTAVANVGINAGPQVNIVWKYTTPLEFLTAEVTLVIPAGYAVSAANPVRYYHAVDTFLGGSDQGCGVKYVDANGKRVVGTYPPASGTLCPSSTAVPPGVSIVESFRERSGLTFSHYCTNFWANFWDTPTSGTACAIDSATSLTDAVTTTYQDTGIGIEYDFTAAGTYTFSYDFVIGTTVVPVYDHIEIQHDGSGALCPDNITVLACTSSGLPCAPLNYVNTGTLTGTLFTSPATPAVIWAPSASFTLGSSSSTAALTLKGVAPGGTYTLSASGMSSTPLQGTKCWNTATSTASCTFVVANSSCFADRMDACSNLQSPPTPARCGADASLNRLYTKVVGQGFNFDLVVLNAGTPTTVNSSFSNTVQVDLVANPTASAIDATTKCPTALVSVVAAQSIPFSAGRPATASTFSIPAAQNTNAYRDVRVRFDQGGGVVTCSSDNFAIRPAQFTVTAPAMNNTALTGTPKAVAGSAFSLNADAGVTAGYSGTTPALDVSKVSDHNGTMIAAGTLSGTFSVGDGTKASGAAFKYLDVGNIQFATDAVIDSSFTSVDQTTDCIANSSSNTLSAGGQYGCNIGSAATGKMGRWYPSHYSFAGTLTPACVAGGFTYMDNAALGVALTLKAHASTGATASASDPVTSRYTYTSNPATTYANLASVTLSGDNGGAAVAVTRLASPAFPGMPNTALWSAGLFPINLSYAFSRLAAPDGPYDLFKLMAAVSDPDSSVLIGPAAAQQTNTTKIRFGRLHLQNAYGSELLALSVPLETQYWSGSSFARNTLDTCTSLGVASVNLINYQGGITATNMGLSHVTAVAPFAAGLSSMSLSKPSPAPTAMGSLDLILNLGSTGAPVTCPTATPANPLGSSTSAALPYLGANWCGAAAYDRDPSARATFGIYKSPLIYRRENY